MSEVLEKIRYHNVWWIILDCGHWYKWTGETPSFEELDCPGCKVIKVITG